MKKEDLSTSDLLIGTERPENEARREEHPAEHRETVGGAAMAREEQPAALFASEESGNFRSRWQEIQTGFVDEPRRALEQADSLVASAMKRLSEIFSEERHKLEQQWDKGGDLSTEDLRVALQRYRSFFNRLLSI